MAMRPSHADQEAWIKPLKGMLKGYIDLVFSAMADTISSIGNQTTWARALKTTPEKDYPS